MTFADVMIVLVVGLILFGIIYRMTRKKDQGVCANCAYGKQCSKDECFPKK